MPLPKTPATSMYRELHIPARDLVSFMQSIYTQRRVGTLTVSFGTGGVPCGMIVWKERITPPVEPTITNEPAYATNPA